MLFRRAPQKVEELKIVIVGAGEVGFHIAQRLSEEQKQVVVIDQNPDKLRRIEDNMDVQTVLGSGSIPSVLKNAGAGDAAIFLAVTDSDETNIVACLFANTIAPKAMKLARIRTEEYTAYPQLLGSGSLQISMLINPEQEIVRSIERLLTLPGAVEYGQLADGFIRMVGMRVESGPLIEQPLTRFREIVQDDGIMVGAIARGQKLIVPSGSDVIKAGDTVYFAYKPTSQRALLRALHKTRGSLGTACIVGGGNIGLRLARLLENKGVDTKLIDISEERCEQLADQLQGTLVLHGDGTDKSLLQEEHIDQMDAFIAVTGDEESNILSCLLAKSLGVKETVARVNKAAYLPLVEAIGIAHSVSPRLSAVNRSGKGRGFPASPWAATQESTFPCRIYCKGRCFPASPWAATPLKCSRLWWMRNPLSPGSVCMSLACPRGYFCSGSSGAARRSSLPARPSSSRRIALFCSASARR